MTAPKKEKNPQPHIKRYHTGFNQQIHACLLTSKQNKATEECTSNKSQEFNAIK